MRYQIESLKSAESIAKVWDLSLASDKCLVLLPPASRKEADFLIAQLPKIPPDAACLAVFTSGSEGNPKAVFHSEASLRASAKQIHHWLQHEAGVLSTLSPWSMAGFLFGTLLARFHCQEVYQLLDSPIFAAPELIKHIDAGRVSKLITHPFHLRILFEQGVFADGRGKQIAITSFTAPLPKILQSDLAVQGVRIEIGYGLSEAAGPVLIDGKSLGAICSLTEMGELSIAGAQLMLGYARGGEFLPQSSVFSTGDFFTKASNGSLQWNHRSRDLIDMAGRKISPVLVEELVLGYSGVRDCLAYPIMDKIYGQRVGLLVEEASGFDAEVFRDFLDSVFSSELKPKEWRRVESLPRLASGKKDRKSLLV